MSFAAAFITIGAVVVFGVVAWKLFFSGEVVGTVKGPRNHVGAAQDVTIVVKRRASRSGTVRSIQVHAGVLMASSMFWLTEAEAQRLADILDDVEAGKSGGGIQGVQVEVLNDGGRRSVGVSMAVGPANATSQACLAGGDAHKLAQYLRIAATPGSTVQRARWNLEKKNASRS